MTSKRRGLSAKARLQERSPGVWRIRYRTADGKRHTETVSGGRVDAQRELRRLLKSVDDNTHVAPERTTVAEFLERWDRDWAANNISRQNPRTLPGTHPQTDLPAYRRPAPPETSTHRLDGTVREAAARGPR